ncbi:MAG: Mrp/NBP35 family ATP-binding protein [Thermoprotei archaeon]
MSSNSVKPPQIRTPAITIHDILVNQARERMKKIKYKIAVLSGKGGVGKSFISASLSLALAKEGYRVALLDGDLHGSSIPTLLGIEEANLYAGDEGIIPARGPLDIAFVSIGLMLPRRDTPVVWRGPLKSRAIIELLAKVVWGERDFLVIDLPPGTGDEVITIVQTIQDLDGAIVVTAPSILSEVVVAKALRFLVDNGIRVLGIVENMCYFKCPDTGKIYYLLGKSTGEELARKYGTELLAKIPLDPLIPKALEERKPYYLAYPEGEAAKAIRELTVKIIEKLKK